MFGWNAPCHPTSSQVWPNQTVTKSLSSLSSAWRTRKVGLFQNDDFDWFTGLVPLTLLYGGVPGWLPRKSISSMPLARRPWYSGASSR